MIDRETLNVVQQLKKNVNITPFTLHTNNNNNIRKTHII